MPKVVDQFLGRLRGKIGDVIFKISHGISYATRSPLPKPASTDPVVIARQTRFGLTIKFAHAVNAISLLRPFWKNYIPEGSKGFQTNINKIMRKNFTHVQSTGISDLATLVPELGFTASSTSITLANDLITVVLAPIGNVDEIDLGVETSFSLALVLYLKTPIGTDVPQQFFIHSISDKVNINLTNPLTFTIPLTTMQGKYFDLYSDKKAFFALITSDINSVPHHYSDTFVSA